MRKNHYGVRTYREASHAKLWPVRTFTSLADRVEAVAMVEAGMAISDVAYEFLVDPVTVWRWVNPGRAKKAGKR